MYKRVNYSLIKFQNNQCEYHTVLEMLKLLWLLRQSWVHANPMWNSRQKIGATLPRGLFPHVLSFTTIQILVASICPTHVAYIMNVMRVLGADNHTGMIIFPISQDNWQVSLGKKDTIQQVTSMLATSENVLFPDHNHLLTTSADDPALYYHHSTSEKWSGGYLVDSGFFAQWR